MQGMHGKQTESLQPAKVFRTPDGVEHRFSYKAYQSKKDTSCVKITCSCGNYQMNHRYDNTRFTGPDLKVCTIEHLLGIDLRALGLPVD